MEYSDSYITSFDDMSIISINSSDVNIEGIVSSDLETYVMKNDIVKVEKLLSGGATIFLNKNNVCTRVCNGYYDKKGKDHPFGCDRNICNKTSVYYGLVNNYLSYKTVQKMLFNLQYLVADLRAPCTCCVYTLTNSNPQFLEIRDTVISMTNKFKELSCECNQKYNMCKGYKEDFLHFGRVYSFLYDTIEDLSTKIIKYYNIDLTKLGRLELESFDTCIHADILKNPISNCSKTVVPSLSGLDINKTLSNLILSVNYYLANVEIMKMLFNQQSYEIYQYTIRNNSNEDYVIAVVNNLYKDKVVTCVNYLNLFSRKTVLDITAEEADLSRVASYIFSIGCVVHDINILNTAMKRGFYFLGLEIYKHSPYSHKLESVNGKSIFNIIMFENICPRLKLKYVEEIVRSGVDLMHDNPIVTALEIDNSYNHLEILINDSRILNSITSKHTDFAITKRKSDALTYLFKHGADPNGDSVDHIPLITYIDTLDDDEDNISIEILSSILSFSPDLNIKDKFGYTSLHLAARHGRLRTLENLLDAGADPFIVHIGSGETPLMTAIEYDQFDIVNRLVLHEKDNEQLVNVTNSNKVSPLMMALLTRNPIKIIRQLEINNKLDYEYYDDFGRNVLAFIIETKEISREMKYALFDILAPKMNLEKINKLDSTPIIVKALRTGYYDIVKLIIMWLYDKNSIIITGNYPGFVEDWKYDIEIFSKNTHNYYSLVLDHLRAVRKEENICEEACSSDSRCDNVITAIRLILYMFKLAVIQQTNKILYDRI